MNSTEVTAALAVVFACSRAIGALLSKSLRDGAQIRAWREEHGTGAVFRLHVLTLEPTLPQVRELRRQRNEALRAIRRHTDPSWSFAHEPSVRTFGAA